MGPRQELGETFNPLGPYLVTATRSPTPARLGLRTRVNGVLRQDSNTANLIFGLPYLIWYLSQHMVLEPGDVINTGTPAGVALGLPGPSLPAPGRPRRAGDHRTRHARTQTLAEA